MALSGPLSRARSEFDDFLFAPLGDDANGMPISVLSTLARLEIDPWQEAAELARLPVGRAAKRLASSIGAGHEGALPGLDAEAIAARVIKLLPSRAGSSATPGAIPQAAALITKSRFLLCAAIVALALCVLYIVAGRVPPDQADGYHGPVAGTVSPQSPPTSSAP
jgi:hypothetical protein